MGTRLKRALAAATLALLALGGAWQLALGAWIPVKAALAQVLLEQAWRRTLAGEVRARPWPWADTWPVAALEVGGERLIVLADAGLQDVCRAFGCDNPHRIDRVLYRSGRFVKLQPIEWKIADEFVSAAGMPLSDHLGVATRFHWAFVAE